VVPNRSLKGYLKREVDRAAQAKSIKLRQLPEPNIESGESCYLGRVAKRRGGGARGPEQPTPEMVVSVSDVARSELARVIPRGDDAAALGTPAIQETAGRSGFDASVELVGRADAPRHFETETGVSVVGAEVAKALGVNVGAEVLTGGTHAGPALIRLHPGSQQVGSVILRFADGSGTVLAAVKGYIGSLVVDAGRVVNVSYVVGQ
jgi:hypothetical protein